MEKQEIQELIFRFNSGSASHGDNKALERLLESGLVRVEDLEGFHALETQIGNLESPTPSEALDDRFYQMLAMEKAKGQPFSWDRFFTWPALAPKLALASVMLIAGLLSGYFLSRSAIAPPNKQIETLSQQVSDLQEMMMLSLLEKESATDRLKAVNLTQEMGEASLKVTNALIKTLNSDENVNVRLAALDALRAYARNGEVRAALIRSIAQQRSPLVQISMAELMADLQEKSAVKEFDKIVSSNKTPAEVKKKIKESIKVLI